MKSQTSSELTPVSIKDLGDKYELYCRGEFGGLETDILVTDSFDDLDQDRQADFNWEEFLDKVHRTRQRDRHLSRYLRISLGGIYSPEGIKIIFEGNRTKYES